MESVAQALKISGQAAFRRSVKVIALAAAVAGDRRKSADKSLAPLLKMVGQDIKGKGGSGEIRIQNPASFVQILRSPFRDLPGIRCRG